MSAGGTCIMKETRYLISETAKLVQVEPHVLRYWEEELELRIGRNELGHRYYTPFDIQLFLKINELKSKGLQLKAIRTLIRRAMSLGYYEGVNLSLAYCDDCGHEELEMDVCPACGSKNLTKIDRMNGYLSYSRVKGDTRLNESKMAEIAERVSMSLTKKKSLWKMVSYITRKM